MVVIRIIAVRSKAILLVVVLMARNAFIGMDLFDMVRIKLLVGAAGRIMVILVPVSSSLGCF